MDSINTDESIINDTTIIVASMNNNEILKKSVTNWLRQPISQIIVIDWNSTVPLNNTLKDFNKVVVIQVKGVAKWVKTWAYNIAIRFIQTDKVLKLEYDTLLPDGFIHKYPLPSKSFLIGNLNNSSKDIVYMWKFDFEKVGGYNELITNSGHESDDLYVRLTNNKLSMKPILKGFLNNFPLNSQKSIITENTLWRKTLIDKYKLNHSTKHMNKNLIEYNITNFDRYLFVISRKDNSFYLKNHNGYLCVKDDYNTEYRAKPDNRWILKENAKGTFISTYHNGRYKFIGMPNADNKIYLYSEENVHTAWKNHDGGFFSHSFKFDKKKYEIVIARYKEDIQWSEPFRDIRTVYNKGPDTNDFKYIKLPNVGRESHTYLYHIINNYDKLANMTLFTQGSMCLSHKPYSVERYIFGNTSRVINLYLKKTYCDGDGWGRIKHTKHWKKEFDSGHMKKAVLAYGIWWDKYVQCRKPHIRNFRFSHGAIFSVNKRIINNKCINYYKNLISCIDKHVNPEEGHYFERSWNYIMQ